MRSFVADADFHSNAAAVAVGGDPDLMQMHPVAILDRPSACGPVLRGAAVPFGGELESRTRSLEGIGDAQHTDSFTGTRGKETKRRGNQKTQMERNRAMMSCKGRECARCGEERKRGLSVQTHGMLVPPLAPRGLPRQARHRTHKPLTTQPAQEDKSATNFVLVYHVTEIENMAMVKNI